MRKILLLIAVMTFIPAFLAHADDTAFGGSGAAPMPIKQTDVAMLNEQIVISGHEINRPDMKGEWKYNCEYTFKNETNSSHTFQMGFPFPVDDQMGEITTPLGYTSKKGSALVHDFAVTINGKSVPAKATKIASVPEKGINYEDAYIWQITMPANQIVKVHHYYVSGVTINVMGQNNVSFVLKTGGLWKGDTIGSAHLEVVPNTPTRLCTELDKSADYLKTTPAGMQIVGEGKDRKYVWDLQNFAPKEDLELCLINNKNYVRYYIVYPIVQGTGFNHIPLNKMSPPELQVLRNSIYAQYGKQFDNPKLQEYFNKQWWYEPSANYSENLLTEDDKKAIDLLVKMEAQRKL